MGACSPPPLLLLLFRFETELWCLGEPLDPGTRVAPMLLMGSYMGVNQLLGSMQLRIQLAFLLACNLGMDNVWSCHFCTPFTEPLKGSCFGSLDLQEDLVLVGKGGAHHKCVRHQGSGIVGKPTVAWPSVASHRRDGLIGIPLPWKLQRVPRQLGGQWDWRGWLGWVTVAVETEKGGKPQWAGAPEVYAPAKACQKYDTPYLHIVGSQNALMGGHNYTPSSFNSPKLKNNAALNFTAICHGCKQLGEQVASWYGVAVKSLSCASEFPWVES